jgi:hypothetical protein
MAVDDENFLATVARHFVGRLLQKSELQIAAVGNRARFVLGFENLPKIIFGKDDGEFLLDGVQRSVPNVEKVRSERKMRAVLFQYAERQDADAFRLGDGVPEIGGGELFPFWGKFCLSVSRDGTQDERGDQ